ncbi:MAG TPA: AAA family ATPase [Mycobacteriales bacterium]|nr:AAA family ATPase [Mycobacteriales bacterium]
MSGGSHPAATTTVTVVFTDLAGSTALFSRLGPEAAESLRSRHIQDLRKAVADHGGETGKDLGDGIMAVFGGAKSGLDAAVAIQQAVDRHNRTGGEALAVRVGVSTGEAFLEAGDHHGDVVVEASRICAIADGGQILATEAVRVIARRTEHRFTVVGERDLKGLPEPVLVVEVEWDPARETAPVPVPPRLAGFHQAVLVGRRPERTTLNDCLSQTWAGGRHVVLVGGEPGVGKTRLCSALAATASDLGAVALYGRCDEEVGRPYQPWVEALQYLLAHFPADLLDAYLDEHRAELHRLLPDVMPDDATPPRSGDPESERYRLWSAVVRLLAHVSTHTVVVLVLDDLQWADRESLQLLRHLSSLDEPMRVLVLATYRDTEVGRDHPLADLLAWLRREPHAKVLNLKGLGEGDIVDLMEHRAGHRLEADGMALATVLWEETGGNPFFAGELLRHLSETDAITRRPDGHWVTQSFLDLQSLPASVREVIGHRVRRLGAEAEQILGVASVVGQYFDLDVVAATAGVDEDRALEVLERAGEATLVIEVPGTQGRFAFHHALIQHTLYSGLSATRRQRLHRRVAETLEDRGGDDLGDRVVELARHWGATAVPTDANKAIHYASLAGDSALLSLGPDEALRCYAMALDVMDEVSKVDERLRCQLKVSLGVAQSQTGDAAFRDTLLDAGRQAAALGEADLVVRAALAVHRGFYASATNLDHDRIDLIETALRFAEPDSPERARLLATLASELTFDPDQARRKALASEAVAVARRSNDPTALIDAVCLPRLAVHLPDTLEERLALTAEAVALSRTLDDPAARFWAIYTRRYPLLMSGEIDEADQCLEECKSLVAEISRPALLWSLTLFLGIRALHAGDAVDAERLAGDALKLGTDSGQADAAGVNAAQLLFIRWHQGRMGEVVPMIEQIRTVNANETLDAGLAMAYAETSDLGAARQLLADARHTGFGASIDYIYFMVMSYWSVAAVEVGDTEAAAVLYDQLFPWHDRVGFTGVAMTGSVAHYLGRLANLLGKPEQAAEHFRRALSMHERLRAPFFIASTQLEWGRLLLDTEPDRARGMLTRARDLAATHGCARVERLASEALSGSPGPLR